MPEGVDLFGLYNKVVDWRAVRNNGIEFAWVKLSDGETNRDDYGYVAGGKSVGIKMGGYHYAQPGNPVSQADRLIDQCTKYGALELAPALDMEAPFVPGRAAIDFSTAFLNRLAQRGHVPVLYANNSMLDGILIPIKAAVPGLKVWGARYGAELTVPHNVHQYTSSGSVNGIVGAVDRNRGDILFNKGADIMTISNADAGVIMDFGAVASDAPANQGGYVNLYRTLQGDPLKLLREIKAAQTAPVPVAIDYDRIINGVVAKLTALSFKAS